MWPLIFLACPKVDQQALRQDDKEQVALQQAAELYWQGVRWGEPNRASAFIEDPMERARFAAGVGEVRYTDVKVLHAELDPAPDETPGNQLEVWRTAKVYVRIEKIDNDNVLRSSENTQVWYRTSDGWYVEVETGNN